jgi:integrase
VRGRSKYFVSNSNKPIIQSEAYGNFINSINSDMSRYEYSKNFKHFLVYMSLPINDDSTYDSLLKLDKVTLESKVRNYIVYLRHDKKLAPGTISTYLASVTHFFEMNDISLHWKKLRKFKAKHRAVVEDKPYTHDQIKKLVGAASMRDKAIITLMASSGMRRGAIPCLRLKDVDKIEKYGVLKFKVYTNESESYITYCTPECTKLIDQYIKWRERLGERLTETSPLFRVVFDPITEINRPYPITVQAIGKAIHKLLESTGVRVTSGKRSELMETHGLRKFFKTESIQSGMHPLYSEYLMGHRSGLTKSYFKPTDQELLEGNDKALGYVAAINDLTINEEHRLHKKIDELTKKKDEIEFREMKHREELKSMREEMESRFQQILTKIDLTKIKSVG